MAKQTITIDAKGKSPGRVATEVVRLLSGKNDPSWAPNRLPEISVIVTNAAEISASAVRDKTKVYRRHSGAPGGFREVPFSKMFANKPEEVIRLAVYGMLPHNRLRARALRNLTVLRGTTK